MDRRTFLKTLSVIGATAATNMTGMSAWTTAPPVQSLARIPNEYALLLPGEAEAVNA